MSASTNHVVNYRGVSVAYLLQLQKDVVARKYAPNMEVYVAKQDIGKAGVKGFFVRKGQSLKVYKKEGKAWKASIPYVNTPGDKANGEVTPKQVVVKAREEWTTEEVCEYVVKPGAKAMFRKGINVTAEGSKNLGAYNESLDPSFVSATPFAGAFISQARGCKFQMLVNALSTYFSNLGRDLAKQFVWLDVFCCNQHALTSKSDGAKLKKESEELLQTGLHTAISNFEEVVMFIDSWKKPTPLTRMWCVWELLGISRAKKDLQLALPEKEKDDLLHSLRSNYDAVLRALTQIDAARADCYNKDDKRMITEAIESGVGFADLNEIVISQIRTWLLATSTSQLRDMKDENEIGQFSFHVAELCEDLGDYDQAEKYFQDSIAKSKASVNVAKARVGLAGVLRVKKEFDKAEAELDIVLKGYAEGKLQTKEEYISKSMALNEMASTLMENPGKKDVFSSCEKLFLESIELRRKYLGDSPLLAESYNDYALLLRDNKQYEKAEKFFKRALEIDEKHYGKEHPEVATDLNNYAKLLIMMNNLEKAEKLVRTSMDIRRKIMGPTHVAYARSLENLAEILAQKGEDKEAEATGRKIVAIYKAKLGEGHLWYKEAVSKWG